MNSLKPGVFILVIGVILISGCAQQSPAATPTPASTPTETVETATLSEQPNQAVFNEWLTEFYLAKLPLGKQVGPPNFPVKTAVFTSADQFCSSWTLKKIMPAGTIGGAVYDTVSKEDIRPKSFFPMELPKGNSAGCEDLQYPPGKYEYKIYIKDDLAAVLPFEVK